MTEGLSTLYLWVRTTKIAKLLSKGLEHPHQTL
jgi:hypothetical protein